MSISILPNQQTFNIYIRSTIGILVLISPSISMMTPHGTAGLLIATILSALVSLFFLHIDIELFRPEKIFLFLLTLFFLCQMTSLLFLDVTKVTFDMWIFICS
ncbi:MAG: hypothetical protein ACE5DO_09705 [Desulfobacterales bacterium]